MIVVSDTSPLNYLVLTESIHVLPAIFGRVYAPSAVVKELSHPRSPEAVRTWASSPARMAHGSRPDAYRPLAQTRSRRDGGDLAGRRIESGPDPIDERKGYKAALQRGLSATTTLGLLEEASHRGLIDFEKTLERLDKETTFYVTEDVLEEFRRRVREQQHAQDQDPKGQAKLARNRATNRVGEQRETRPRLPARTCDALRTRHP